MYRFGARLSSGFPAQLAAAILSDLLAQWLSAPYPEGAFVAGLMHNIGKLLIGIALPGEFGRIHAQFELGGSSLEECEREVLGATHAAVSGAGLQRLAASCEAQPGKLSEETLENLGVARHAPRIIEQFQPEFDSLQGFF